MIPASIKKRVYMAMAVAACFGAPVRAETIIGAHLGSVHQSGGFNGINPGLYARLDNGVTFGTYRNSINRQTVYGGWTWQQDGGPFAVSAVFLTGYRAGMVATIIPSVRIPIADHLSARVAYIYAPAKGSAVHLSAEWTL